MKKKNKYKLSFDKKAIDKYRFKKIMIAVLLIIIIYTMFKLGYTLLHYDDKAVSEYYDKENSSSDVNIDEENSADLIAENIEGDKSDVIDDDKILVGGDSNISSETEEIATDVSGLDEYEEPISDNVLNHKYDKEENDISDEDNSESSASELNNIDEIVTDIDLDCSKDEEKSKYDYSKSVLKTDEANEEWHENTVFIGNSVMDGLALYDEVGDADVYSARGIKVDTIFTKEVVKAPGGTRITIFDAMEGEDYDNIYVLLGANELGWPYIELFISEYEKVIDKLQEMYPDANIYICGITPVTASKSASTEIYTNSKIAYFNKYIFKMCEDRKIFYLDSVEALGDDNDELPEDESTDGVHFKADTYNLWIEYLKMHTVDTSKYNNL